MIILSQVGRHPPEMERDKWWDDSVPKELPYTISALPFRHETDMALTDKDDEAPVFLVAPPAHGQDSARKLSSQEMWYWWQENYNHYNVNLALS